MLFMDLAILCHCQKITYLHIFQIQNFIERNPNEMELKMFQETLMGCSNLLFDKQSSHEIQSHQ